MDRLPDWMTEPDPVNPPGPWRRLMDRIGPRAIRDRIAYRYVRTTKVVSGIAAAVALFGAAGVFWAGYAVLNRAESPPAGVIPTPALTGHDAFAGTPAEGFAAGAAGIQVPPAKPVGPFSAALVDQTLAQVKEALMAARLNTAMLIEHDPDPFLSLLRPATRVQWAGVFESPRYAGAATQIADRTAMARQSVRVKGAMTYRVIETGPVRILEVVSSYVWAYPLSRDSGLPTAVVVHDRQVWQRAHPDDVTAATPADLRISLVKADADVLHADCAVLRDTGRLAPDPAARPSAEDRRKAFDPAAPLGEGVAC